MSSYKCPKCHNVVNETDKFCPDCGLLLEKKETCDVACKNCNHKNESAASFCEKCGTSLNESSSKKQSEKQTFNTIQSEGNYSGTMVKGKTSKSWKVLKIILLIVGIIAVIAFVVWFNTDPDAKEKLGNILFGFVVMAIFAAVIWRKSKKGQIQSPKQRKANYDDDDIYEQDNDDFDDD